MSLERFKAAFKITSDNSNETRFSFRDFEVGDAKQIIDAFGGKTFNNGLYRVLRADQISAATQSMEAAFPANRGRIMPFAFDWLGRHFAIDRARIENGKPQVLMLEIGAGEAMEIPASILDFHDIELVDYANEALAALFWKQWRDQNPNDLAFSHCVGYKVPLFLGGADVLSNLEVIDLSVYVELCGQLKNKIRTLAPGQSIRNIQIGN